MPRARAHARNRGAAEYGNSFVDFAERISDTVCMTREQVRIYRAMTPARKLELATRFYFDARSLKAQAFRMQHPEWSEAEIERRVREIFLYAAS